MGPSPGAVVVRSDVTRKRMLGVEETQRLPPEAYTADAAEKVFAAMAAAAEQIAGAGHAVILDGVYREPHQRAALKTIAERAGVPFHGIWLEAPAETLEARIAARRGDASDATVEVMRRQLEQLSRPADWYACAADRPVDAIIADLRHRVDGTD
jgi:predicted kinase